MLLAHSAKHRCALSYHIREQWQDVRNLKNNCEIARFPIWNDYNTFAFFMSKNSFRKIHLILATEKLTIMKNHG